MTDSNLVLSEEQRTLIRERTTLVLKDRAKRISAYKLTGSSSDRIKINPYLLPIVSVLAPSLTEGTGRRAAAQYLITARFVAGIETSAGKLFDEQFMRYLGAGPVPDKDKYLDLKKREGQLRKGNRESELQVVREEMEPLVWLSEFDCSLSRDGVEYYISLKLGPWTINDTMAREMASAFGTAVSSGIIPVLGIIYGEAEDLSNKPGIVLRGAETAGGTALLKLGPDLMTFVTGNTGAASVVMEEVANGCQSFLKDLTGLTPFELAIDKVDRQLAEIYGIEEDASIFEVASAIAFGRQQ